MGDLDGIPPIARNGLMRSNSYDTRRRLAPFGFPQAGPHQFLGNEHNLPYTFSLKDFLQGSNESLECERAIVGKISTHQTVLKLKMISLFADMGTDRAQAGFTDTFYKSPKLMLFVARQGNAK